MHVPSWCQYNITFPGRLAAAETAARKLLPALTAAQDDGLLHTWWFIRKQPWRLRYLAASPSAANQYITALLNRLAALGQVSSWAQAIYEPETRAFGGCGSMTAAHTLFHHDSTAILTLAAGTPGQPVTVPAAAQREVTVLLCSAMLRAAQLDWYEQGDVWARIAALRKGCIAQPPTCGQASRMEAAIGQFMTADARRLCDTGQAGPLAGRTGWLTAFESTGAELGRLAGQGQLTRGLRGILAHHMIFHANRAGIPATDQSVLASAAATAVFGNTPAAPTANPIRQEIRSAT
jgi:protein-L-isoaspartate(D-aspartate) O-methyltransferase